MEIETYACVDEYGAVEQEDGVVTHNVWFEPELDCVYGRLLAAIRHDGYEVVAFGDFEDDSDRLQAIFVTNEDYNRMREMTFDLPDADWITDLPR